MSLTRHAGRAVVWGAALCPVGLWLLADTAPRPIRTPTLQAIAQLTGLMGTALFALSFVLATRLRWLEDYFGGLDKMYQFHHTIGLTAFGLLLLHPLVLAFRFVPDDLGRALLFLLPIHQRLAVNLGVLALGTLVLLIGLTLYTRVPYDTWKVSHKLMGLAFALGAVHVLWMEPTRGTDVIVARTPALRYYMMTLIGIGGIGAIYTLLRPWLSRRAHYTVNAVHSLNEEVLEIELAPQERPIEYVPGQYVFVTFIGDDLPREAHPFTICSPADQSVVSITVKALGDFTHLLYERLQPGMDAQVDGPYGRFDYRDGGSDQVWIAGGVGIAPFLSWVRHMRHTGDRTRQIEFYYCVHSRGDAVYHEELADISTQLPNFELKLICSVEDGHLHASDIEAPTGKDIFLCGPRRLTTDLQRQLRQLGVPSGQIHFEDFEFRT